MTMQESLQYKAPTTWEEKIDEIMDLFDFDRVHTAMEALKWEWADVEGVPSKSELRQHARRRLRDVVDNGRDTDESCGGFRVIKDGDCLALSFEIGEVISPLQ